MKEGDKYEINDIIIFGDRIAYIIKCDNFMFECWFSKYRSKKFSDYFITIKELRMLKLKKLASV